MVTLNVQIKHYRNLFIVLSTINMIIGLTTSYTPLFANMGQHPQRKMLEHLEISKTRVVTSSFLRFSSIVLRKKRPKATT